MRITPFAPALALAAAVFAVSSFSSGARVALAADASAALAVSRGDSLARAGERERARESFREGARRAAGRGERGLAARALASEAEQLIHLGRPRDAEAPAREALRIAGALRDTTATLRALRWLAVAVGSQGRGAEMAELWRRSLPLAQAVDNAGVQGFAHLGLGHFALANTRTREAIAEYDAARRMFLRAGDRTWALWATLGLGDAHGAADDGERARASYRRILEQADPVRGRGLIANALNNLAVLEYRLGDPAAAAAAFRAAYALPRDGAMLADRLTQGTNLAICEGELGRYDDALALLDTLLAASRERGFEDQATKVLLERGDLLRRRGRLAESARCLREALSRGASGLVKDQVEAAAGLAHTLTEADSLALAEAVLDDFARRVAAWGTFHYQAELDLARGEVQLRRGRLAQARKLLARAERAFAARAFDRDQLQALIALGEAWLAGGARDSASAVLVRAETLWEHARGVMSDPEWREVYGDRSLALHELLVRLALDPASGASPALRVARAFEVVQRYKARTLHERMLGPGAGPGPAAGPGPGLTLRELQRDVLREDECFIEMFAGRDTTLLFAVTRSDLRITGLSAGAATRLLRWRRALATAPDPDSRRERVAALKGSTARLRAETAALIAPLLGARPNLILCPDGALNLLPFALLIGPPSLRGSRPGPDPGVAYVPSAAILARIRRQAAHSPRSARGLLALAATGDTSAPATPAALAEARRLSARFVDADLRVTGPGPSRAPDDGDLARYGVLHFAAHALADDQHPWRSGVRTGGSGAADPYLRAARIAALPLRARLVVLAGCETAGGRALCGEGVQGLTAAFLVAGVPTVIASLWPVEDRATARFTQEFYGRLARGRNAAEALRAAQAVLRSRPETADPFYWAGFVVVGEPRTTLQLRARSSWRIPLLVLGIAAVAALLAGAMKRAAGAGVRTGA